MDKDLIPCMAKQEFSWSSIIYVRDNLTDLTHRVSKDMDMAKVKSELQWYVERLQYQIGLIED